MSDSPGKGNQIIRFVMLAGGAVGLFSAGLVGTLGVQGKLNKAYLGPLVGMEVAETNMDELHELLASSQPAPKVPAETGPGSRGHPSRREASQSGLMPDISLPSPFSAEEVRLLFEELEQARAELRERVARVTREEKDLDLVRADLNHRWDELNRREEDLEEKDKSLKGEQMVLSEQKGAMADRALTMTEIERSNIEALAADIEKMTSDKAAALLLEKEPDKAALILSFIKAREAGKILAGMPAELAADITERMLGILKPRAGQVKGEK
ncbi:MAG: hypothetical protein V2A76_09910 [Planctomycetota bacterium]